MTTSWRSWLRIHPAAELFPLEPPETIRKWADDMKVNGQRLACTYIRDEAGPLLLDGRNRLDARELAGLRIDLNDRAVFEQLSANIDVIAYVISLNINHRHLDPSQRAMIAADLANMRQGERTDLPSFEGRFVSQEQAAKLLNVGIASVERAKIVRDEGSPELQHAVERGRVSVSAAADIATAPLEEQREIVARGESEILKAAQEIRARKAEVRRAERDARLIQISRESASLPHGRKYPIILADPPWEFSIGTTDPRVREPRNHYQTMPLQDICDMQIGEKIATPDAVLFLWVPAGLLFVQGASVLNAWGFEYRTNMVWVKDLDLSEAARRFGLGFYCRTQHEHLLIATRGERLHPSPSDLSSSVIHAPRREHSRKPDEAYALIERMYPELPKIELFARGPARPGWDVWGNEALGAAALVGGAA
jgi:N6-adenosine-specific RNA methylase IME4